MTLNQTTDEAPLVDHVFDCLDQLDVLKIQNEHNALRFYNQTFAGLTNVSILDLTGCPRIDSDGFYDALSDETILPKLSHFILVGFRAWGTFKITQDFVNIIGVRDIVRDMNLSFTI